MSTTAILADGLLDDAAMFPPGDAPADTAIRDHLAHRDSWYSRLVGPLLIRADRWGEFVAAHEQLDSPALDVVLIGSADRPSPVPPQVSVIGHELPAPERVDGLVDSIGGLALEVPTLGRLDEVVGLVADLRARGIAAVLKYRTGGVTAEAFPGAQEVATVIAAAVQREIPVKFTAGLHHAVRHRDPSSGFEHHGFLNLLWAVVMAHAGVPSARLAEVLDEHDPEVVQQVARSWSTGDISAARGTFVSFGCCDVTEPIEDLVALGLIGAASSAADGTRR